MAGDGVDACRRRRRVDTAAVGSPSTSLGRSSNLSAFPAMSKLQVWAELPDALLHSIVDLLGSFADFLAFASTCHPWRAAFSSYPSKYTLSTRFPPLLLQPDVPLCSPRPRPFSNSLIPERPCCVTDLANKDFYMCCQVPHFPLYGDSDALPSPVDSYYFRGTSYGHLILMNRQSCLVVDVFTGASVSTPKLPFHQYSKTYYAALTAPLRSPNSHLLVTAAYQIFCWRVGSHSWLRRSTHSGPIKQIVVLKGQVIGLDYHRNLFIMHLVPQIRIQQIVVDWEESMTSKWHLSHPWLVVYSDMLLLVGYHQSTPLTSDVFEAFRLDLSSEPAKWVKLEKLENWAIFVSIDGRSQPLCCMNPERWGGRSNCIYCYIEDRKHWVAVELGEPLKGYASNPSVFTFIGSYTTLKPMWVVPSMFSSCL